MKVYYEFISSDPKKGKEVVEVEVSEDMGAVIMELDRDEYNNNHKETRRHLSYSRFNDKIATLDSGIDIEEEVLSEELKKEKVSKLHSAMEQLNEKQKKLINSIYFENISVSDVAEIEGVTQSAISQRLSTAIKKLKKFYEKS